jgi:hypothetical protein
MGFLDKFLRLASTRYPEAQKLNRVMAKVGRDIEKRHLDVAAGVPGAEKMFVQRDNLYGRLLDKLNETGDTLTGGVQMNPQTMMALEKFLAKMGGGAEAAGKTALGLGARAVKGVKEHPVVAGLGAAGGYGLSEGLEDGEGDERGKIAALLAALGIGD